ncbi:hypothetical protein BH11GEM1_BH11GEM1_24880 [soil metagenome]
MNGMRVCAGVAMMACVTACDGAAGNQRTTTLMPPQDSIATALEMRASLSGGNAPGAQSYSFRGLYAGMTRAVLESRAPLRVPGDSACHAAPAPATDLTCTYEAMLGSDSARVGVDVQYGAEQTGGSRVARVVAISRDLPLDVDGVQLARTLADAFADQTALLDKRDASYGRHQAQVRMGTVSGARKNYVELTVVAKGSREVLTVKMSRL